jgi:hypothetical protein
MPLWPMAAAPSRFLQRRHGAIIEEPDVSLSKLRMAAFIAAALCAGQAGQALAQNGTGKTCQGGTGSAVLSVATTATEVCAASASSQRLMWRITANGGTTGSMALACTDDGTTPSSTHWTYQVGGNATTASPWPGPVISQNIISCISVTGSAVPIVATAAQPEQP